MTKHNLFLKYCINFAFSENRFFKGFALRAVPANAVGYVGVVCGAVIESDYFAGCLAAGAGLLS